MFNENQAKSGMIGVPPETPPQPRLATLLDYLRQEIKVATDISVNLNKASFSLHNPNVDCLDKQNDSEVKKPSQNSIIELIFHEIDELSKLNIQNRRSLNNLIDAIGS